MRTPQHKRTPMTNTAITKLTTAIITGDPDVVMKLVPVRLPSTSAENLLAWILAGVCEV